MSGRDLVRIHLEHAALELKVLRPAIAVFVVVVISGKAVRRTAFGRASD
jgi:hypothetical protein